jgi:hypothetical protein
VIRQARLIPVVGAFLIAVVVVGCGSGPGYIDERGGEEGAAATNEEATAPAKDRSAAGTAREEPAGLDAEVVSPLGQANMPAGFGEGSLWATGFAPSCHDTKVVGEASATSEGLCAATTTKTLKRVDPRTGEKVAAIPLKGVWGSPELAVGAGSVWVSSGGYGDLGSRPARYPEDLVLRVDLQTNRVVDRIPVDTPMAWLSGSVRCG